jgi:flavin-dependent dehydrogenase
MTDLRFCAVVAGGGPAGAAAALALARGGRRVLLVEERPAAAFRVGEALPPAGRPLLRDLGALDRFLADGHLACHGNQSAWGSPEVHATDFIFDVNGHGWQLDRARFDASLRAAAEDAGSVIREAARVASAEFDGDEWRVSLSSKDGASAEEVRCGWIVDATGRSTGLARRHGATRTQHDALVAFYARVRPSSPGDRDARTLIEAVPDGWWYTALVPSGERVVAYLTDADLADRAALLSREGFAARLVETDHVAGRLVEHGYTLASRPRGADASSARLDRFVGEGWVAAGDAAISFDPLSSQGILTALYTGMRCGDALAAHLAGDASALAGYAARMEEIHHAYEQNLTTYYAFETRWPDREFWRRRLPSPVVPSAWTTAAPEPRSPRTG